VFVVTLRPEATGYYARQLTAAADWHEIHGDQLVLFAVHGPAERGGGRRSVLVVPLTDVLALDEVDEV
jgi:hypothetical protein